MLDFPVALKTGTTRAYTDDLAFGTTAEYTVGAWAGNFDGSPTAGVMAMQGAAPLVRAAFVALAARFGTPTAPARPRDARARRGVRAVGDAARAPTARTNTRASRPARAAHRCAPGTAALCGRREVV